MIQIRGNILKAMFSKEPCATEKAFSGFNMGLEDAAKLAKKHGATDADVTDFEKIGEYLKRRKANENAKR